MFDQIYHEHYRLQAPYYYRLTWICFQPQDKVFLAFFFFLIATLHTVHCIQNTRVQTLPPPPVPGLLLCPPVLLTLSILSCAHLRVQPTPHQGSLLDTEWSSVIFTQFYCLINKQKIMRNGLLQVQNCCCETFI